MAIPTMAIGCAMVDSNAGPSIIEALKDVTEVIENASINPPEMPTHLGVGFRFGLNHTADIGVENNAQLEVDCRLDLLSFELGSSGLPDPRPMPAIHIESKLTSCDQEGEEKYLLGGPGEPTRLRSIDLDVSWHQEFNGSSGWNSELSLNDAAFMNYVDWSADIPGKLKITNSLWDAGASEVIDAFLEFYSLNDHLSAIDTFLSGLDIMGLAYPTDIPNPISGGQDIRWHLDTTALQTFIQTPRDYIEQLLQDPHGNWDLGQAIPSTGLPIGEHIAEFLPGASWNTSVDSLGQLEINLPIFDISAGLNIILDRYGDLCLGIEPFDFGPMDFHALIEIDAFDPSSWIDGPAIELCFSMNQSVSGFFEGSTIKLCRNSPWTLELELANVPHVPVFTSGGISFSDDLSQTYNLLAEAERNEFLSLIPGFLLDSTLQMSFEKLLLQHIENGSLISRVFAVLNLTSIEDNGAISANSILPWLLDPVSQFSNAFLTSNGLNIPSILELADAILECTGIDLEQIMINETVPVDFVGTPNQIISELRVNLGSIAQKYILVTLRENPATNGLLTISLEPHPDLGTLGTGLLSVDGQINVNISSDLQVSLDGSYVDLSYDMGTALSGIQDVGDDFFDGLLSSFRNSNIDFNLAIQSGSPTLSATVNFDVTNSASVISVIHLYPNVQGVDSFLAEIASAAITAILPELLEYAIGKLDNITLYGTVKLGDFISGILQDLNLYDGSSLNLSGFTDLANNPIEYLKVNPRLFNLFARFTILMSNMSPSGGGSLPFSVTSQNDGNLDWYSIQYTGDDSWLKDFTLDIGDKVTDNELGIWLTYSNSINLPDSASNQLSISGEIGLSRDSNADWNISASISAYLTEALISAPFVIQPSIKISYTDEFRVWISSGVEPSGSEHPTMIGGSAFWIKLLPQSEFDYGIPDLSALLLGAANTALDMIENITEVQDFLSTGIYKPSGTELWKTALSKLTVLGDWLAYLGVCTYHVTSVATVNDPTVWRGGPPVGTPTYNIRNLEHIVGHYKPNGAFLYPSGATNVFDVLLRGIVDRLVAFAIDMATEISENKLPIFKGKIKDSEFTISLNVQHDGSEYIFGVNIDFSEDIEINLGSMKMRIFTQDLDDESYNEFWCTKTEGDYSSGITLQLLKFDSSTTQPFEQYFSLEFGHFTILLEKQDKKPMLDGFILLNTVSLTTCVDLTFNGGTTADLSFRLDLDDFGLSLGGNGENDGGNGLAAGVLDGGEGGDAVKPMFDIAIWANKLHSSTDVDFGASLKGEVEYWFPINKQFGPVKIAQIGVKYESEDEDEDEHRLSILIDGEAEIAGFLAQVDDLSVSIPLLDITNVSSWKYDMAGCAISYSGPAFEIAGALRKTHLSDGTNEYVEYQGLCTISTDAMAISAIGAFGRVPVTEGDSYVTCFVIAAIDYPIGGIPEFFVTGLAGGLGLNRDLVLPNVTHVPDSPFMRALSGFGDDPMGALESIRGALPAKRGSLWFAVGVKFTTYQVLETKAVLFIKISDGFTVGILGMSSMSLPTKEFGIGYIELAFLAYYDSQQKLLWVEAQLTDASYLFDKNCRLTGGFALVSWMSKGEFLLSMGGYHPKFKAPSYYPEVPRLGFNWKPISKLTIKGGAYFTICTSAVMLGGNFEASFKAGSLSASFKAGTNILVVFDPFYYSFDVYIGVSVRLKTWLGTLKGSLGADLEIEGPKMRGKARIKLCFISFTVKFGPSGGQAFRKIPFSEFVNKHVLQLPEGESGTSLSSDFGQRCFNAQVPNGLIRSEDGEERKGTQSNPWLVLPEFELVQNHIFPASSNSVKVGGNTPADEIYSGWRTENTGILDEIQMAPCGIDSGIISSFSVVITKVDGDAGEVYTDGISKIRQTSNFPETIWRCKLDGDQRPEPITSPGQRQPNLLSGSSTLFRAISKPDGWQNTMLFDQVTESRFIHNLPFIRFIDGGMPNIEMKEFEPDHDFITVEKLDIMKDRYTNPVNTDDILSILANPEVLQHNKDVLTSRAKMTQNPARMNNHAQMNNHATTMENQQFEQVNMGGRI